LQGTWTSAFEDVDALLLELGPELADHASSTPEVPGTPELPGGIGPATGAAAKGRAGRGMLVLGLAMVAALTLLPGMLGLG
jgi:hypothetical protein